MSRLTAKKLDGLKKSLGSIEAALGGLEENIFAKRVFEKIFVQSRTGWGLDRKTGFADFADFLFAHSKLSKYVLNFPGHPVTVFAWGKDFSAFEIALALGRGAYLSHFTAAYIHRLTEQVPKTIYVTVPQPAKRNSSLKLTQEDIHAAFSRPTRPTRQFALMGKFRVARLTGMDTKGAGVVAAASPDGGQTRITSMERTLVDIVVRPNYCGGIQQVLNVFSFAKGRVSTRRIADLLKKLQYLYPYHQAVGFYMERAGYPDKEVGTMRRMGVDRDFYLAHDMRDKDYCPKWRLFFPKGF